MNTHIVLASLVLCILSNSLSIQQWNNTIVDNDKKLNITGIMWEKDNITQLYYII